MFVKWKRGHHHRYDCTVESACVVESTRTPAGPRQRYVCYLGSIAHSRDNLTDHHNMIGQGPADATPGPAGSRPMTEEITVPTEQERREYPWLSEEEWEGIEEIRARKARGEWPFEPSEPGSPSFEEQVLALLREQSELLRSIDDKLGRRTT
jgi:hypothetical protein